MRKAIGVFVTCIPIIGVLIWGGIVGGWWLPFAAIGVVLVAAAFVFAGYYIINK